MGISSFAQDSTIFLGQKKYTKNNNKWYVNSEGTKYAIDSKSITVKLKENISIGVLENVLKNSGIKILRENILGYIDLEVSDKRSFYKWHDHLSKLGIFESVEVNSFGKAFSTDPGLSSQYYLYNISEYPRIYISYDHAWFYEDGSTNPVTVAVIDDGLDFVHEDLNYDDVNDYDYITPDYTPAPDNNSGQFEETHGTAVAGIISAKTYNGTAIAGIAGGYNSSASQVMALRVAQGAFVDGHWINQITASYVDDAIIHAANNGAKVINMSFGVSYSASINSAINYAYKAKNCVLVAATGNDTDAPIRFPANHSFVIAVSGILLNGSKYGNNNGTIDVVAPAQSIYTTLFTDDGNPSNNDKCGYMNGTSFSAPQVSGVAALLLSHNPSILNSDIRRVINYSADGSVGSSAYFGNGLLNGSFALETISESSDLPETPSNVSILAIQGFSPRISWSAVSDVDNYKIYRSIGANSRYYLAHQATVSSGTTFWVDNSITVAGGDPAYYRVSTVYNSEESILSSEVSCSSNVASKQLAGEKSDSVIEFKLHDNYPNPFNPTTKISFTLPSVSQVNLQIYNILGELVSTLVNEKLEEGYHSFSFNASNSLPSGIYIYRINVNGAIVSQKKMMLLK